MRTIFITGAGSGIGAATARLFAAQGWRVGLADRAGSAVRALALELGGKAYPLDVTDRAAMASALADFTGSEGALDVLFNCAGLLDMSPFAHASHDRLDAIIDVNVKGVINGITQALPYLRAGSCVVTMSSAAAIYGVPDLAVYSASKFAVRGLTEALNVELDAQGIWVCDVMVGYVDTPMLSKAETTAKSVGMAGINVTPQMVAQTVLEAVQGRQVHWFVLPDVQEAQAAFDAAPLEERRAMIAGATGY